MKDFEEQKPKAPAKIIQVADANNMEYPEAHLETGLGVRYGVKEYAVGIFLKTEENGSPIAAALLNPMEAMRMGLYLVDTAFKMQMARAVPFPEVVKLVQEVAEKAALEVLTQYPPDGQGPTH